MVYIVHTGRHTHGKWQYSCRILLPALWFWVFGFSGYSVLCGLYK